MVCTLVCAMYHNALRLYTRIDLSPTPLGCTCINAAMRPSIVYSTVNQSGHKVCFKWYMYQPEATSACIFT